MAPVSRLMEAGLVGLKIDFRGLLNRGVKVLSLSDKSKIVLTMVVVAILAKIGVGNQLELGAIE